MPRVDLGDGAVGRDQLDRRRRLSAASPYLAISQPSPPPSVSPAIPVVEIAPPVTASPCSRVASLSSPHSDAALGPHGARVGIDLDPLHLGEVDHHRVVGDRAAGDVVAAAPDR